MNKLMDKLTNVMASSRLAWIRLRAERMWDYWVDGLDELQARVNATDKPKKKVYFTRNMANVKFLGELLTKNNNTVNSRACILKCKLYVATQNFTCLWDHQATEKWSHKLRKVATGKF